MSSETLYRKYRSKDFSEVIGQEHITKTLLNSIKNDSFAHAYLLTGPRGVGKTTVARLFAYKVNGVKYGGDETYSDIIEIDAASNRRIDEIRELREKVNITPSALKYKVYIIDEVHMLTKEAFNALLKTLEEPPEHAIFVLATTDFHKVPDTIKSRCIRFAFSSIPEASIKEHLKDIAKKESIDIEDEALEIIADNSDGSFRDAISLLDQFRNSNSKIKADYVAGVLGMSPEKEIEKLLGHIAGSKPLDIIESLDKLRESGSADSQIIKQLIGRLREGLLGRRPALLQKPDGIKLIDSLLKVDNYNDKKIALEIALLEACDDGDNAQLPARADIVAEEPIETSPPEKTETEQPPQKQEKNLQKPASAAGEDPWALILSELKSKHNTLYAIARMADARIDGEVLELYFKFPFHYKQMKLEKNHMQLEKVVSSVNKDIKQVKLIQQDKPPAQDQTKEQEQPFKSISNIFGPSEVLES